MVLVTCAYGKVGRQIVPYLASHGVEIRAFDLNPAVENYLSQGIKEVMIGDGSDKKDLAKAMEGIDCVIYIPPQFTYLEAKMGKMAIDAAIEAGVKQFICLSVLLPNLDYKIHHKMKEDVERYLMYRGFEHTEMLWTILQPSAYHHNIFLEKFYADGVFPNYSPIDRKISWLDARDEADVILKVLADPEGFNHGTFPLSNEKADAIDVARIMTEVTGKQIEPLFADEELQRKIWPSYFRGGDSYATEAFFRIREANTRWGWDGSDKVLRALLDHEPRTIRDFLEEEAVRLGIK